MVARDARVVTILRCVCSDYLTPAEVSKESRQATVLPRLPLCTAEPTVRRAGAASSSEGVWAEGMPAPHLTDDPNLVEAEHPHDGGQIIQTIWKSLVDPAANEGYAIGANQPELAGRSSLASGFHFGHRRLRRLAPPHQAWIEPGRLIS